MRAAFLLHPFRLKDEARNSSFVSSPHFNRTVRSTSEPSSSRASALSPTSRPAIRAVAAAGCSRQVCLLPSDSPGSPVGMRRMRMDVCRPAASTSCDHALQLLSAAPGRANFRLGGTAYARLLPLFFFLSFVGAMVCLISPRTPLTLWRPT